MTRLRVRFGGVLTVFDDVEVETTQVINTEVGQGAGDDMEVHIFIGFLDGFLYFRRTLQDVLIQRNQLIHRQGISRWFKAV